MIGIGADHGGYKLKNYIKGYLDDKNTGYTDFGVNSEESADYPDVAKTVCTAVLDGSCDVGILICGTGIGMSIAANKIKGIRAAHVTDTFSAKMAREHNNANILCIGERITGVEIAREIVETFLNAKFQGGRHERRVGKITALENK